MSFSYQAETLKQKRDTEGSMQDLDSLTADPRHMGNDSLLTLLLNTTGRH